MIQFIKECHEADNEFPGYILASRVCIKWVSTLSGGWEEKSGPLLYDFPFLQINNARDGTYQANQQVN